MPPLILASQSPRRKALLGQLGLTFSIQPAHVDESVLEAELPIPYIQRVAKAKALAVAAQNPGAVVLAADTPVILHQTILQTPHTADEATAMLRAQSGQRVQVPTAVVVVTTTGQVIESVAKSWLEVKHLTEAEITHHIASGTWQGSSGGLQIEHEHLFTCLHGSHSGIMGLPLYQTTQLLRQAGFVL